MNLKPDVLIVGAGVSGITCAIKCQDLGVNYLLIEKKSRSGGRLGSIYDNGYIFDIGFQVFNTSYEITKKYLDLNQLDLHFFKPGSAIYSDKKFTIISDPLRDFGQIFNTLFSKIPTLADKMRILKLKFSLLNYVIEEDKSEDQETIVFLKEYGFSENMISQFFSPFFAGIFLENKLSTSSKFFKYVFSKFGKGLASLPSNGMQEIAENMLRRVDREAVVLNCELEHVTKDKKVKLKDGTTIVPSKIVFTGNSQKLISEKLVNYNGVKTLYFNSSVIPDYSRYIHIFPQEEYINNIAFLTSISQKYSRNNDSLISVSIIKEDNISDSKLITHIKDRLMNIYGGNFNFLKNFNIEHATINQPVQYFDQKHNLSMKNGYYLAGDNLVHGSIEGAAISGIKVAEDLNFLFNR